jgi:hypothetical protein
MKRSLHFFTNAGFLFVFLFSISFGGPKALAQCTNTSSYGSATAPVSGTVTITTIQYAGEYATISSVVAGTNYVSTSSIATDFITIHSGTYDGPVVAYGLTPLTWTATVSGTYFQHCNTDAACGIQSTSRTTTIGVAAGCTNTASFGSATAPTTGSVTISTCQYAGEYATINSVVAGSTYVSTSSISTDYITIRSGSYNGPIVASGLTPLTWTATIAGTYYQHLNTNAACGTENVCRTITIGIVIVGCLNSSPYGSAVAPTSGVVTITSCQYASEYAEITSVVAGTTYVSTSSVATDYITLRSGTYNGPIVAAGLTPLTWTATVAGTYFQHLNTNAACGTDNTCRVTTIGVARPCGTCTPEDVPLGNIGTVVYGYSTTGNLGNGGKWVGSFTGEAGMKYHFDLCPDLPGAGTNNLDIDIKITDASCNILTGADGICNAPTYAPNDFQWTCTTNGTYYVILAPYNSYATHNCIGTSAETFTMQYYKEATVPVVPVVCPANATIIENEPDCYAEYVDATNGGCNSTPNVFTELTGCKDVVCGKSGTYTLAGADNRDTDWYRLVLTGSTTVNMKVVADFPLSIIVADETAGCAGVTVITSTTANAGDTAYLTTTFGPGTLIYWVGPSVYTGVPCGSNYVMFCNAATISAPATPVVANIPACVSTQLNTMTPPAGETYYWQGTSCGASIASPTSSPYPVTASGTYYVRGINNAVGCWSSCTPVAVTISPMPSAAGTITGTSTICAGVSGTSFSVPTITDATSYVWSYTGTGATINGTGSTVTVDLAPNATSGNLTVAGSNSCGNGTVSAVYPITVSPLPTSAGAITGTTQVCAGNTGVAYSVPVITDATSYIWSYTGTGATIIGTGNAITIDFASNATSGNLTVQGNNTCGNGTISAVYAITVNTVPVASGNIEGSSAVCAGVSGIAFSVPPISGAISYIWNYTGTGATINGSGFAITIDFATNATSGTLTVQGNNPCGNGTVSGAYNITVNPLPGAAGSIAGYTPVCAATNGIAYSIPLIANATNYNWLYTGTGVTINGTGNAVTLDFAANATTGNLTVQGTNSCGIGTISIAYGILVNTAPAAATSILGVPTVCAGVSGLAYSVGIISGATSYIWNYTGTGATIYGTGNSVTIDFASNATSGTLTVQGSNTCGNGTISSGYSITISPLPSAAGTITGTTTVCSNSNGISYSVPVIGNSTGYVWLYSGTGATLNGTGNAITIDFAPTATGGSLSVAGNNSCGNGTPASFIVVVDPCTGIEESQDGISVQIVPNPNSGVFSIEFTSDANATYRLRIANAIGQVLIEDNKTVTTGLNHIDVDMSSYATGTYYLNLVNNDNSIVKTILIRR